MSNNASLTRRQLLQAAVLSAASPLLSGCWPFTRHPSSPCHITPPNLQGQPLTIDAHCHIFNGSDLEVKDFFDKVAWNEKGILGAVSKAVGAILEDLVWMSAPTGDEELALLAKFEACLSETQRSALIKQHHDERYNMGRNALLKTKALSTTPKSRNFSQPLTAAQAIAPDDVLAQMRDRLQSQTRDEYKAKRELTYSAPLTTTSALPTTAAANVLASIAGALDYVLENFQYRYGAVQDYLATYGNTNGRNVDLMIAAMVDYDWPLSEGCPPVTNLKKQIEVMAKISIVSRGQVHGFVPFDPFREVAFYAGKQPENCTRTLLGESSLDLVQDAIKNRGCLGVKLYPPMGFAAYGNAGIQSSFWKRDWLPEWIASDKIPSTQDNQSLPIGKRLDDALAALYTWCSDNEVPILAHSNASNGVILEFKELAGPDHWKEVLTPDRWPNLRVSFGHLGGFSDQNPVSGSDPAKFIALMSQDQNGPGRNVYADAAYFSEVLDDNNTFKAEMIAEYQTAPVLPGRLMYGTDWELLINVGKIKPYLTNFVSILNDVDTATGLHASERFFGYNAAEWIGLKQGMPARTRVIDFYKKNGLNPDRNPPAWMQKVDSMPHG